MAHYLIRWALPHKGKPLHLTSFEYYLRWLVFLPLWLVTIIPSGIAFLFLVVIGPFGIAAFVGLTGIADGTFIGFSADEKAAIILAGVTWATSLALNQYIQHRFIVQR
ncbi:hypothetical protein [Aureimonas ureilytica]|uniref:hypothetical protein n=1 Tax=Aureimonas ureilytica TaxID=401562 RepID=UPI00037D567E|nr:hypothetical protein [Aureimonas ureilytica]